MLRQLGLAILALGGLLSVDQAPKPAEPPTYHRDIAPMLAKSCLPCHRSGGVAPFSLESFADVKRRASLVQYQVLSQAMPPHRIRSDFGELTEAPPLSDADAVRLQDWIRAGAPEGEVRPKLTPKKIDWRLGPPDLVVRPQPGIAVPAEGAPYWQAVAIPLKLPTGRKLRAFDLRPATPQVLRSATVGIASSKWLLDDRPQTAASLDVLAKSLIGSWAPGFRPWSVPDGVGFPLAANAVLAVQLHFRPKGKVEDGRFELALYFENETNSATCNSEMIGTQEFVIEANRSLTVETSVKLDEDQRLLSLIPEARFFASRVWVEAVLPNGVKKTVYDTLRWNPYWAGSFSFAAPPVLPKGTILTARATYDNDERCVANEGKKPQRVVSGPKLTDEMFRVHLVFTTAAQHK